MILITTIKITVITTYVFPSLPPKAVLPQAFCGSTFIVFKLGRSWILQRIRWLTTKFISIWIVPFLSWLWDSVCCTFQINGFVVVCKCALNCRRRCLVYLRFIWKCQVSNVTLTVKKQNIAWNTPENVNFKKLHINNTFLKKYCQLLINIFKFLLVYD